MSDLDPSDALVFRNPILRGFNPDPSICVVPATDDKPATYFLTTSTFEYFPGCAIYTSTDLFTWQLIGHALTRRSQIELRTVEPGAGSWASTLRYREDEKRWYLANCLFQRYRPASDVCYECLVEQRFEPVVLHLRVEGSLRIVYYRNEFSLVDFMYTRTIFGMRRPGRTLSTLITQDLTKM